MQYANDRLVKPLVPKAVLVAYEQGRGSYYLESHNVSADGTVGAARGVSKAFVQTLARSFSPKSDESPHGAIPSNLLYADWRAGSRTLVWWNPPRVRGMVFTKAVNLEDGDYHVPGVIYRVTEDVMYVYAFAGRRPTMKTRLLKGPFFNYYNDCRMCLGNSRRDFPQNPTWEDLTVCWENIFWNSENAHLICEPLTVNLVKAIRDYRDKPFNTTLCRTAGMNLGEMLKRIR